MILKDDTVLLRDFKREDIAKRIEWETEKTEWQLWDAPWEYEGLTEEQKKENLQKYIKALEEWAAICESLSDEMPRKSFQICTPEGEYVGWCGSYFINEDCCIDENGDRLAIGIDLPEEKQIVVRASDGRALIFSTAQLAVKTTRSAQGVAVMSLKRKAVVESAMELEKTAITNVGRYSARTLPAAGALLREEDTGETQMKLDI